MSQVNERDLSITRAVLWAQPLCEQPATGPIRQVERKAEYVAAYREAIERETRATVLDEMERLAGENYGRSVLAAVREMRTASKLREP